MLEWQARDIAIAIRDAECGCGEGGVVHRQIYRVESVIEFMGEIYLEIYTDKSHVFHHSNFRRETPAKMDIFSLATAPKKPELVQ